MFCSRCGKTLMPEDTQCPHCGTPVGESRFEGTPYTSAQAHILPNTPAGQASAAYTRTTYTTIPEEQQEEGAVDSRTSYRPPPLSCLFLPNGDRLSPLRVGIHAN